ncbi:YHYH protein [Rubritalea tangerina]|uniref:YHYH protein n=1 Tax=Rubritalea tangerina TaxID=430798 RepID=A0ABW4Z7V3_9BACT
MKKRELSKKRVTLIGRRPIKVVTRALLVFWVTGEMHAHEGVHERESSRSLKLVRDSEVSIQVVGERRVIKANGLPNHKTGRFPNRNNPNEVREQSYLFEVPAKPEVAGRMTPLERQPFGVALNGVVFDPGTAEMWNGDRKWTYEALTCPMNLGLDHSHAHVQPTGAYHYHGMPNGLLEKEGAASKVKKNVMVLAGWAADGFPIYAKYGHAEAADGKSALKVLKSSYVLKKEMRLGKPHGPGGKPDGSFASDYAYVEGAGDLDACNGRFGVTAEFPGGTYYYVLTEEFPFIPRFFKGKPDPSFGRKGGQAGERGGEPGGRMGPPHGGGGPPHGGGRPPHRHRH